MSRTFLFLFLVSVVHPKNRTGIFISSLKFFWSSADNGTVSKFPPIVEFFVQRIQTQNSNFVHEDLSRPPTWEKPVYTLSPSEQVTAYQPLVTQSMTPKPRTTTPDPFEYEELEETTEKFFEIIAGNDTRTV